MSETSHPSENAPAPEAEPEAAPQPALTAERVASSGSRRATSDVSALRAFGLAIPFYGLALLLARMAPRGAREILLERGWPPHATLVLASLAIAILLVKARGLRKQRRAFALELMPASEVRLGPEAAGHVVDHVESLRDLRGTRSFLLERVLRVLSQFAAHGSVAEATTANDAESDADASSVAASFSTVKVLVWAMPILGLIGTVVGLSGAVGAFSHAMSGADQLDTIKDSLRQVTTGLAVAFDATFVALTASILVMLPMTWLQKAEDKLVNDVDDYCITHVLSRLASKDEIVARAERGSAAALDANALRSVLAEGLVQPVAAMMTANVNVLERMTRDREALKGVENTLVAQLSSFAATLERAAPLLERAVTQLERATAETGRSTEEVASKVSRLLVEVEKSTAAVGPGLTRAVSQLDASTAQATQGIERAVAQLERASAQLSSVGPSVERAVTELAGATAVAEQAATASERAQDHLSRELGASRQLLSLLAAGLGAADGSPAKPRAHNGGANYGSQVGGAGAAGPDALADSPARGRPRGPTENTNGTNGARGG
jgi:biopolymer transport protein ExbB/TolQ